MKKFLIILLAALLTFSFISCGEEAKAPSIDGFVAAVKKTNPKEVLISIKSETALGELNGTYKTVYAEDGSFTIEYSYEKFNEIGEGAEDELTSTVTGTVTCDKNGNYSDGGALTGTTTLVTGAKINLAKAKATVSMDGNSLTAKIKAADTKAVLGVELPSDAELVMAKSGDVIVSYTIKYQNASGEVVISCEYK